MSDTFKAEAIQFLRPDGRQNPVSSDLPIEYEPFYDSMKESGCRLECEELTTGAVSFTISNEEEDVDISLTSNGPDVVEGLLAMLKRESWKGKTDDR